MDLVDVDGEDAEGLPQHHVERLTVVDLDGPHAARSHAGGLGDFLESATQLEAKSPPGRRDIWPALEEPPLPLRDVMQEPSSSDEDAFRNRPDDLTVDCTPWEPRFMTVGDSHDTGPEVELAPDLSPVEARASPDVSPVATLAGGRDGCSSGESYGARRFSLQAPSKSRERAGDAMSRDTEWDSGDTASRRGA